MLLDYLESVRSRSAQVRASYAFFFALGTTGFVVVVWLSTLLLGDAASQTATGVEAVDGKKPSLKDIPGATKTFLKEHTDDTINWDTLLPPPTKTPRTAPVVYETASGTPLTVEPFATGTATTAPRAEEGALQGATTSTTTFDQ